MEAALQSIAAMMQVISVAVAFYLANWFRRDCLNRRWNFAIPILLVLSLLSLYAAYFVGHQGPWSLSFGITIVRPEIRLYAGALAELMVVVIGVVFGIRILSFSFRDDLDALVNKRDASSEWANKVIQVSQLCILVWIALYHFHPDYGPLFAIQEGAKVIHATDPPPDDNGESSSVPENAGVTEELKQYATGTRPISALYAGSQQLRKRYAEAVSLDDCREAFVKHFSISYLDSKITPQGAEMWQRFGLAKDLRELSKPAENDDQDSQQIPLIGMRSERDVLLAEYFDELVYAKCMAPYALYSLYSTLAFAVLFLSIVSVPLYALPRYRSELQASIEAIRASDVDGESGRLSTEQAFSTFWNSSKIVVAKYTEILALIAFFLVFELIIGFDTLTTQASQITFAAALLVITSGVFGFGSAVMVESAIKAARERLQGSEHEGQAESPSWLWDKNVRTFSKEIKDETTVGAVIGFVGFSALVGVVTKAALYMGLQ